MLLDHTQSKRNCPKKRKRSESFQWKKEMGQVTFILIHVSTMKLQRFVLYTPTILSVDVSM